jgi:hypothetical protein
MNEWDGGGGGAAADGWSVKCYIREREREKERVI